MNISAAGLSVQRMKLDVIAENLANVETTKVADGGPYRRKTVSIEPVAEKRIPSLIGQGSFQEIFAERLGGRTASLAPSVLRPEGSIVEDEKTPFTLKYEPGHPDADEDGVVTLPNVNVVDEMVDMIIATRAYEANVTAIQSAKDMFMRALDI